MSDSLKKKTAVGVLWSGVERFSAQGIRFLVVIVLARLLTPKDFGLIAMMAIFLGLAQSLVDSGFSQALVRKQDRTETDNCTVFYFNIVVGLILYLILYITAPFVSSFYDEPQLTKIMRVVSTVVIINSFSVVQRALFTTSVNFKVQAYATIFSAVLSGIIGIIMAYQGFGVWTLVAQQIIAAFINTLALWFYSSWRPVLLYSWRSFRELFSFGSKMLLSGLLDTVYVNLYRIVIGKIYNATNLGYYNNAQHFAELPSSNITSILQRVTYPVLCSIQGEKKRLVKVYRQLLRLSAFIVFPLMCTLAAVASPLIDVLLGEKWHFVATLLVPLCFGMMWYPIHAINLNLLMVAGRSDLFLKLEVIKKILGVTILVSSIPFGLVMMCYATIASSLLCLFINTYYTKKLIGVGFFMQIYDIMPTLILSISMWCIVSVVDSFITSILGQLIFGLLLALAIFIVSVRVFDFKELSYLNNYIRHRK